MKGDFSRKTFDRTKHYAGVLMQQGRVQVDADWNEQGAIDRYLFETEGTDVIGACGAPIGDAGFQVTTDGTDLLIGGGRFYVDGILAENDFGKLSFDDQAKADFPGASLKEALAAMKEAKKSLAIAYLDVWRRHVTALDDTLLREVALGGPDTTTRLKTIWQVRLLPVAFKGVDAGDLDTITAEHNDSEARLAELDGQLATVDADLAQRLEQLAALREGAPRARLETTIKRLQANREKAGAARTELADRLAAARARLKDLRAAGAVSCDTQFPEWDALFAPGGKLNARALPGDPSDDPCELPPGAGYTRLENQLYRVEVHQPGDLGKATFKWSRDNGTVVTAIRKISGSSVFVHDLGPDDVLGFANGQWVELSDDTLELNGLPGQLCLVVDVKPATNELVLDPAPTALAGGVDGVDPDLRPKLRRWDQKNVAAAPATEDGVETGAGWLPLEDGVEGQFSGGPFRTGDYWLIPARTATGDLEWPPFELPNLNPVAQPRRGIIHHYCRLALLELDGEKLKLLEDCRKLFPPLTDIQTAALPPAVHVIATSWENDGVIGMQEFLKDGLRIRLDAPPAIPSVNDNSILVTLDIPYQQPDGTAVNNALERVILLGKPGIDPSDSQTIVWRWDPQIGAPGGIVGRRIVDLSAAAALNNFRINVTLRGHFVWHQTASQLIHVDGQAFAQPETDPATGRVQSVLVLPSGAGVRASDFESWFVISQGRTEVNAFRVAKLEFLSINQSAPPILTADTFPLDPGKTLTMPTEASLARIRATLNRAAQPEGEFDPAVPQPAFVEQVPPRGAPKRVPVLATVKFDTVDIRMLDPQVLPTGNWRLTILSQGPEGDLGIRAADDGSALDGAYDGTGADFVVPFMIARQG